MPDQTVPAPGPVAEPQPATLTANLHVTPDQVTVIDLSPRVNRRAADLVSLTMGDTHVAVSVLGTLGTVTDVLTAALDQLSAIATARRGGES